MVASEDSSFREASSYISYAYGLVETTQALDPGENFHVEGSYAKSKLALYKGRIGIYEYFPVAPAFVPDISSMEAIGKLQQKREVISFLNYGLRKVSQGLTTESEVLENTAI